MTPRKQTEPADDEPSTPKAVDARAIVQAKRDEVSNHLSLDKARRFYALGLLDEILAQLPE